MTLTAATLNELSDEINKWLQLGKSMYSMTFEVDESSDKPYKAIINELDNFYATMQMETITDLRSFYGLSIRDFCKKLEMSTASYSNIISGNYGEAAIKKHSLTISRYFEIEVELIEDLFREDIRRRSE